MRKNETKNTHIQSSQKAEVRQIISTILEEISKKCDLPDQVLRDYREKLSSDLYRLLKKFDEKAEFTLKIVSNPHEYAEMIREVDFRMVNYDGRDCKEEVFLKKNVIGDTKFKVESEYPVSYNYNKKTNFSLADIQIVIMNQSIYDGRPTMSDFVKTNTAKRFYNISVYIPKERDEKENSVETYQELLHKEKRQKIENSIKKNTQETIEEIMAKIEESHELTDSLRTEYIEKIKKALKIDAADFEYIIKTWIEGRYDIKLTIKRNPYEYADEFYANIDEKPQTNGIIGDLTHDKGTKKVDFSIGDIQVCIKTQKGHGCFDREILLYIPEKEFCKEQSKKGVATYEELLDNDKREGKSRMDKLAEEFRNTMAKYLENVTNKRLTKEQMDTILNHCNKIFYFYNGDADNSIITVTSNPDEFAKYLGYNNSSYIDDSSFSIIGDNVNRILSFIREWK